jgi:hypothetical protein
MIMKASRAPSDGTDFGKPQNNISILCRSLVPRYGGVEMVVRELLRVQ